MATGLTTLEAANKYKLSTRYLRVLLAAGRIKGRLAVVSKRTTLWLIEEPSIQKFLKTKRTVGRPKKK